MNLRNILLGFLSIIIAENLYAQQTTSTSGGEATGNGTVNYTVGQVFYTTKSDGNYSISEGVQQAFEISVPLSTPEFDQITLKYLVYPNPTTDFLILKADNFNQYHLKYTLYDLNGKLLLSKKLLESSSKIEMKHLRAATYFLKISDNNQGVVKTFKILKH